MTVPISQTDVDRLRHLLKELHLLLDESKRQEWDRSLPLGELLVDRWERAKRLGFGEGSSVYDSAVVLGRVSAGAHCWVGPNTLLDGSGGGLEIGAHVHLSAGAQVYTHDTVQRALSAGTIPTETGATTIGACTYIGPNVVVQKGVTIGDHCIIGANAFVNHAIPPYSFAHGSPCRVQGTLQVDAQGRYVVEQTA